MNADERYAQCMGLGGDADACHELVTSEMVNGVWCDGEIVYDANGKRCVPRDVLERVRAARGLAPLPVAAVVPASVSWPLVAFGLGCAALLVWVVRR
jgi:hypothetical protein